MSSTPHVGDTWHAGAWLYRLRAIQDGWYWFGLWRAADIATCTAVTYQGETPIRADRAEGFVADLEAFTARLPTARRVHPGSQYRAPRLSPSSRGAR